MDRQIFAISEESLASVNRLLTDPNNPLMTRLLEIVEKYGGVEEINRRAREAGTVDSLMGMLRDKNSPYVQDLEWLLEQKEQHRFVRKEDYLRRELGAKYDTMEWKDDFIVTLEISSLQYFPWFMRQARQAIEKQELMPGRFIRVRKMKEQEGDDDVIAVACAMKILGASYVETLDSKGTLPGEDGLPVNVHLGGPATISGYFGGVGSPNDFPFRWCDEFLYYYTKYGVKQVLNTNNGTVLLGYMMHRLGIDIEFKISVFMGNDNPMAILWTLMMAKMFERDGRTPLIGFNLANSVDNSTIELTGYLREELGLTDIVRIEHHIFETYKSIVRQPYDRRQQLLELAPKVKNISAKHEGGEVAVEASREHPSNILDYFIKKEDILAAGTMPHMEQSYIDKHDCLNNTARVLVHAGIPVLCAPGLHDY